MKVMFDTNIYISFIRNRSHTGEFQRFGNTVAYQREPTLLVMFKSPLLLVSIGATLFTEDRVHFGIISGRMSTLKVEYLRVHHHPSKGWLEW